MQPDKVDWNIIELLSEQYETNIKLAKKMGASEGMIRQRIKRLREAGIIKIRAVRNPELIENQQLAVIAANFSDSRLLDEKAKDILNLKNVISVSAVSGQYDLLIEVLVDSNKGLVAFLTENLSKIDGLTRTETFLVLKSYDKWV
jgi:Lrp/AsnC family transcriptional regulator for asnA, asnC and gidA